MIFNPIFWFALSGIGVLKLVYLLYTEHKKRQRERRAEMRVFGQQWAKLVRRDRRDKEFDELVISLARREARIPDAERTKNSVKAYLAKQKARREHSSPVR